MPVLAKKSRPSHHVLGQADFAHSRDDALPCRSAGPVVANIVPIKLIRHRPDHTQSYAVHDQNRAGRMFVESRRLENPKAIRATRYTFERIPSSHDQVPGVASNVKMMASGSAARKTCQASGATDDHEGETTKYAPIKACQSLCHRRSFIAESGLQ